MATISNTLRFIAFVIVGFFTSVAPLHAQVGGGYASGGLQGEYFANAELSGTTLSINSVMFAPYWAAAPLMCEVAWSVDGGPDALAAMSGTPTAYSGAPLTADLTKIPLRIL